MEGTLGGVRLFLPSELVSVVEVPVVVGQSTVVVVGQSTVVVGGHSIDWLASLEE